jgi:hypothetical protein
VRDCGFEGGGIVDFNCENIKLKFGFRKNSGINREKWTVSKGFDWVIINPYIYPFTKIWVIGCDIESFDIERRG